MPNRTASSAPGRSIRRRQCGRAVLLAAWLAAAAWGEPAAAAAQWRILALRVEFPVESVDEPSTTGTGRFDLRPHEQALADYRLPFDTPPHDREYFAAHLDALARYYWTVSQGQVEVHHAVYPLGAAAAYTMPRPLLAYGSGRTEEEIGQRWVELLRDAIAAAEADPHGPRFADYNSFLVLHAGVGFETGQVNDIRSVFLDGADLRRYAGGPLTADGGRTELAAAWILPETPSYTGQAGLNGLLAKFFGHQLGLPGLSNFADGLPAVGGWSLMDVGANRYNFLRRSRPGQPDTLLVGVGFVPPHPCAWSQARLGWLAPVEVRRDTTVALLALDRAGALPRAVRIPLDRDEYLLLENRQRRARVGVPPGVATPYLDADRLPWLDASQVTFSRPDTSGVWLAVEEYDAFVPGSGVLVYQVNERAIAAGLETDSVNNDPLHPGITLVEADGHRDIGQAVFGRLEQLEGSPDDPFFAGGNSRLGPGLWPHVRTEAGWDAGVALEVLDAPGDTMRVHIAFPWQVAGWPQPVANGRRLAAADVDGDGRLELLAEDAGGVRAWAADGRLRQELPAARLLAAGDVDGHPGAETVVYRGGAVEAWVAGAASPLWSVAASEAPGQAVIVPLAGAAGPVVALSAGSAAGGPLLLVGGRDGSLLATFPMAGPRLAAAAWAAAGSLELSDGRTRFRADECRPAWEPPAAAGQWPQPVAGDLDGDGLAELVCAGAAGEVWVQGLVGAAALSPHLALLPAAAVAPPVLGDVDGDGWVEVVLATPRQVHVLRADAWLAGAAAGSPSAAPAPFAPASIVQEGFPASLPDFASVGPFAHGPALADLDADGRQEILLPTDRGLFALDDSGALLPGFPLLTATPVTDAPLAVDVDGDGVLEVAALTADALYVWRPAAVRPAYAGTLADWPQSGAGAAGTWAYARRAPAPVPAPAAGVLVRGRTYCYPNPVEGEATAHLRFALHQPATVRLQVFDAVGRPMPAAAGATLLGGPAEHELAWEVGAYPSGLYICRLRAQGTAGGTDEVLVKMAVSR